MSTPPRQQYEDDRRAARVYRSRDDRIVGGVAAGIASYLGVDPVLVRLVFVVLALAGGGGVLAYLVAWIIIPEDPAGGRPPPPPGEAVGEGVTSRAGRSDPSMLAGLILIVLGAGLLLERIVPGFSWRFAGPALLVAIGVLLLARGRART